MAETATILVADDDRAIRTVLSQALSRAGHEVRTTDAAATLWQWIEQGDGDLVITANQALAPGFADYRDERAKHAADRLASQ